MRSSRCVMLARVCRAIRKVNTAILRSVSMLHLLIKQHSKQILWWFLKMLTRFHKNMLFAYGVEAIQWLPNLFQSMTEILLRKPCTLPGGFPDETREEGKVCNKNSFVETYKDETVSIKSLIGVYYFQHSQDTWLRAKYNVTHFYGCRVFRELPNRTA